MDMRFYILFFTKGTDIPVDQSFGANIHLIHPTLSGTSPHILKGSYQFPDLVIAPKTQAISFLRYISGVQLVSSCCAL